MDRRRAWNESYGRSPSSSGSHTSVISVEPIAVSWWRPAILRWKRKKKIKTNTFASKQALTTRGKRKPTLINSAIITVLLMALPMAFREISLDPFSCLIKNSKIKTVNSLLSFLQQWLTFVDLEQSGGIGNVVPHPALSGDANLVLVYRRLRSRLLHPLIPIHLHRSHEK